MKLLIAALSIGYSAFVIARAIRELLRQRHLHREIGEHIRDLGEHIRDLHFFTAPFLKYQAELEPGEKYDDEDFQMWMYERYGGEYAERFLAKLAARQAKLAAKQVKP